MIRRALRIASTALITAGLVIMLDVGLTLAWGEPLSTLHGWLEQRQAGDQLDELERSFKAPRREGSDPPAIGQLVDELEARTGRGQAIGRLLVPAIDLNVIVVEGTDTGSLQKGPGRYPETSFPGEGATVAIAGHRTTYLAPFRRLNELDAGDEVTVEMPYARFTYRFEKQRIVDPYDVGVVRDVGFERLVLTACHPLYSAAQRIVVFARLVDSELDRAGRDDRGVGEAPEPELAASGDQARAGSPGLGPVWAGAAGLVLIAALGVGLGELGRNRKLG